MNEHYELNIKRSSPVRRGPDTLSEGGPDTLSRWPGHSVPMARTLCPDAPYNLSGQPVQSVPSPETYKSSETFQEEFIEKWHEHMDDNDE